jgi:hypothetical protein
MRRTLLLMLVCAFMATCLVNGTRYKYDTVSVYSLRHAYLLIRQSASNNVQNPWPIWIKLGLIWVLRLSRRWFFEILWVVTLCSVVVGYQRFRGEGGGSVGLWNDGFLSQHYTASQPRRHRLSPWRCRRHGSPKRWYPITTLHGVTTQKTSIRFSSVHFKGHFTSLNKPFWVNVCLMSLWHTFWWHLPHCTSVVRCYAHVRVLSLYDSHYVRTQI